MSLKRSAHELPPALSTRSKRVKTDDLTPQRLKIAEPEDNEDSESAHSDATSSARQLSSITSAERSPSQATMLPQAPKRITRARKVSTITSVERSPTQAITSPRAVKQTSCVRQKSTSAPVERSPTQAMTPPRASKKKPGRKPAQKADSPHTNNIEPAGPLSLQTVIEVSDYWYRECAKVFLTDDGFEIDIYGDKDRGSSQVVVWELEAHDEALLQQPGPELSQKQLYLPDPARTEADCDFSHNVINPPAIFKEYEQIADIRKRDIPILVIECRGANADSYSEWRSPSPRGISRSYAPQPHSQIQHGLMKYIYAFQDKVVYEPKGWLIQEQCFCATAIGDKIKFWKHVSPYPHLKPRSKVLSLSEDQESFRQVVGERLAEAKEDGYEFAMEMYGRETFAG